MFRSIVALRMDGIIIVVIIIIVVVVIIIVVVVVERERQLKKKGNKKLLVTPASGSPKVDQGLVKGLKLVSKCSQAHNQSSKVVKTIKGQKSINCQQVNVYQSRIGDPHQSSPALRSLTQQSLVEKSKCY